MALPTDAPADRGPLLVAAVHDLLLAARDRGDAQVECTLDLGRSVVQVEVAADGWRWQGRTYPYLERCRDRTIYYWDGEEFAPAARYGTALIKLVPTEWGAPTFEIDGVKMLPTSKVSPYEDARQKVRLVEPRGLRVLDTCAGLGYFAACCAAEGAAEVVSYEVNPDVLWLRGLNPWSPQPGAGLDLRAGDVHAAIGTLPTAGFGAILHDPPRFALAGDLYSQAFYDHLARVLRPGGRLFHYTGTPNRLTTGRDVPREVATRLRQAGFRTEFRLDGVYGVRAGSGRS